MEIVILFSIALIIGIIGAIAGIGGGALLVPVLLIAGVDAHTAVGTSVACVTITGLSSYFAYRRGGVVDTKLGLILQVTAIPGALIGSFLSVNTHPVILEKMLGIFLFLIVILIWKRESLQKIRFPIDEMQMQLQITSKEGKKFAYNPRMTILLLTSFIAGVTSGFFGIGGGVFQTPAMIIEGIPVLVAVATSSVMITVTGFFSYVSHAILGNFSISYILLTAPGLILGTQLGAMIARKKLDATYIRYILKAVLVLFGTIILLR